MSRRADRVAVHADLSSFVAPDRMLDEEEETGAEGLDEGAPAAEYDYAALADAFDEPGSGASDSDASPGAPARRVPCTMRVHMHGGIRRALHLLQELLWMAGKHEKMLAGCFMSWTHCFTGDDSGSDVGDDINPFELAEPTTSEDEGGAGAKDVSDDAGEQQQPASCHNNSA
jgi:hypothetical protein